MFSVIQICLCSDCNHNFGFWYCCIEVAGHQANDTHLLGLHQTKFTHFFIIYAKLSIFSVTCRAGQ